MKCLRRLLNISYGDHKTEYVWSKVRNLFGPMEPLPTTARRKLVWFGHLTRHNNLSKTILQGTVEGGRKRGRQRKRWSDNVKEWTDLTMPDLLSTAADRPAWRRTSVSSALRSPLRPLCGQGTEVCGMVYTYTCFCTHIHNFMSTHIIHFMIDLMNPCIYVSDKMFIRCLGCKKQRQ